MSDLTKKRVHWREYNGDVLEHDEDVDILTSADAVEFSDGEDLQYKYTQGQFVSPSTTGILSNLSTTNKSSLVDAVNEVKTNTTNNASSIGSLGVRMTTAEGDIDTLDTRVTTAEGDIGALGTRVTPINLGGTGATTAKAALTNLGTVPVYTSATSFITYPCTISELVRAMPSPAILMIGIDVAANTITDLPCSYGILTIHKRVGARAQILYNRSYEGDINGSNLYFGNYNTYSRTVSWNKIFTNYSDCQVPIANGGTGAGTAAGALTNLGLTATASELNYCDGVTSNIQTQIDGKANSSHEHSTDDITSGTLPIVRGGTGETSKSGIITSLKSELINLLYPVDSIYMTINSANPSTYFGGTWVAWGSGRVPVGVNTSDSNFNSVEETGGAKTHTLTTAQLPAIEYSNAYWTNIYNGAQGGITNAPYGTTQISPTVVTGGGQAHNNLQPYITCYMWKRTA